VFGKKGFGKIRVLEELGFGVNLEENQGFGLI
jgi:hypothetical protein